MHLIALLLSVLLGATDGLPSLAVRGTVWIRAGDKAVGTGWVVDADRRWVITARHVLADREKVEVFFPDYRGGRLIADRVHYLSERADLLKRGRLATGTVVAKNDRADLALLRLDTMPKDVRALQLSSRPPRAGHACSLVGHRHDADLLWNRTTGAVRQVGRLSDGYFWAGTRTGASAPVLFVQAPIESGESGAALLDADGRVIGVVSAVSNRTPGLAIAIAVSEVHNLLAEARRDERVITVTHGVERRLDAGALMHGSVWVRPRATDGRFAGVLIDRDRRLVLATATAVGGDDVIDLVAPIWAKDRLVAETAEYQDLLGLRLSGRCVQGVVLLRDPVRDLALVELDRAPDGMEAIALGAVPRMGDRVAAIAHPTGEELMWLFAAGSVRSVGKVMLRRDGGDESIKVSSCLLQLPHQGSASGGPVVSEQGKLIGVLASREGSRQELAYSATVDEVRELLKAARPLSKPETASEWFTRARYLSRRGREKSALAAFAEAAKLAPEDEIILASQAKAWADAGEVDSARPVIDRMSATSPETSAILAEACQVLGDRPRAAALAESALKEDPKLASALVTQAWLKSGQPAIALLEQALSIDSSCARAYLLRANLHDPKDLEHQQKALADLTRAIELEPYDAAARARRAKLFEDLKEFKKAAGDWARLTELHPQRASWWLGLADAHFLAGDRAAASRAFSSSVRVEPAVVRDVLLAIRSHGGRLQKDNPSDVQRVAEWYQTALKETAPWLDKPRRSSLELAVKQARTESNDGKRADLLSRAIEDAAGPANRPQK